MFTIPEAIKASEENMAAAYRALYLGWPEARSHAGEEAVWGLTRIASPFINNATRVRFSSEQADEGLEAIIEEANVRQVPMRWWLGPGTQPADIGERLKERGFSHVQLAGMAIELSGLQAPPSEPALHVERVGDSGRLDVWCRVLAKGFDVSQEAAAAFGRAIEVVGLDSEGWSLYLAYLDDEPVAVSSMYLGAGAAGIYNVAALRQVRGKGAGSAVSYAALKGAHQAGYQIATLQASKLGYGVYRRLGFVEISKFDLYVWRVDE